MKTIQWNNKPLVPTPRTCRILIPKIDKQYKAGIVHLNTTAPISCVVRNANLSKVFEVTDKMDVMLVINPLEDVTIEIIADSVYSIECKLVDVQQPVMSRIYALEPDAYAVFDNNRGIELTSKDTTEVDVFTENSELVQGTFGKIEVPKDVSRFVAVRNKTVHVKRLFCSTLKE